MPLLYALFPFCLVFFCLVLAALAAGARLLLAEAFGLMPRAGVSQGCAMREVCELLGLDVAGLVAFGDGENDVELIEEAGFGFAIENGHPRLLAVADGICPTPHDHGVAQVMEAVVARRGVAGPGALPPA